MVPYKVHEKVKGATTRKARKDTGDTTFGNAKEDTRHESTSSSKETPETHFRETTENALETHFRETTENALETHLYSQLPETSTQNLGATGSNPPPRPRTFIYRLESRWEARMKDYVVTIQQLEESQNGEAPTTMQRNPSMKNVPDEWEHSNVLGSYAIQEDPL
ncbi:hypothetical protein CC78DRAFT_576889 [Lojkania enalia]|uniref:Uncharacterized protein n=1 Tax=Lojkania enalia TaxID=147567 RepID=A0A9P4N5U1_9PLEO|nr:hypothetical protein CC78DRAFT_576889 [Didymosphaeria enalia]